MVFHYVDSMNIKDTVTIGITTRNRRGALHKTLDTLRALKLDELRIILIDDGSEQPLRPDELTGFLNLRFSVSNPPLGLVRQRNRIAQLCETQYLLSLDDDSCLTEASSLSAAAKLLDATPRAAAVAFRIIDGAREGAAITIGRQREAVPVRSFIGCGNLLRVSAFLEVGGYRDILFYHSEEREFSLRAFAAGYTVMYLPSAVVHHYRDKCGRSNANLCFYRARNTLLLYMLNLQAPSNIWRTARCIVGFLYFTFRERGPLTSTIKGFLSGIVAFYKCPATGRISPSLSRQWLELKDSATLDAEAMPLVR